MKPRKEIPCRRPAAAFALFAALLVPALLPAAPGALLMDIPNKPVPSFDFSAELVGGEKVKLSDFKGKVIFLNFWATWCPPCLAEMPAMERLFRKMKDKPFHMFAVNLMEKRPKVKKFLASKDFTYDIVMDPEGEISEKYNAENLPTTYILDKQGRIIRRAIGPRIWDGPESVALFEKLVAE